MTASINKISLTETAQKKEKIDYKYQNEFSPINFMKKIEELTDDGR